VRTGAIQRFSREMVCEVRPAYAGCRLLSHRSTGPG
jgi:hypothetical protein